MHQYPLAIAILLATLGNPAFAEEKAGEATTVANPSTLDTGTENQGAVQPDPDGATGTTHTGGITPTAREIIPEETVGDGEATAEAPTDVPPDDSPGAGRVAGTVDPATLREVRQMALEADKKAAAKAAAPEKSAEAAAAQQQAIERHREALFARVEERRQ